MFLSAMFIKQSMIFPLVGEDCTKGLVATPCMYIYATIFFGFQLYIYNMLCVYIYMCIYVCIYIYMCIYLYMYIYIYICIYIYNVFMVLCMLVPNDLVD